MPDHQDTAWANPSPAALTALAAAVFIFYGVFTGKVGHNAMAIGGIWLIGGFFVQMVVGIIELKMGNIAGGNTFTWFSAYFMLVTGSVWVFEYFAGIFGWNFDPTIAGYAWIPMMIVLLLQWPAMARVMPLTVFIVICLLNIATPMIVGLNLGIMDKGTWMPIVGNIAGLAGLFASYSAAAIINNVVFGKALLPFPGPVIKS